VNEVMWTLMLTAGGAGIVHTLLGPDHYAPLIALSRAKGWSLGKTLGVTLCCGAGHLLGSMVLAVIALLAFDALDLLKAFEQHRGSVAAYLMLGGGVAYAVWALRRLVRARADSHVAARTPAMTSSCASGRADAQVYSSAVSQAAWSAGTWLLFLLFVLGPCEPLIPLILAGAAVTVWGAVAVAAIFSLATLGTMSAVVFLGAFGLRSLRWAWMTRYGHVSAGVVMAACGMGMLLGM